MKLNKIGIVAALFISASAIGASPSFAQNMFSQDVYQSPGQKIVANSPTRAAVESLDARAAKECKQSAVNHALQAEKKSWGDDQVGILHLDRSIPMGVTNGIDGNEISGDANVEVTINRESSDPVVHEMRITATKSRNSKILNCRISKEVVRDIL